MQPLAPRTLLLVCLALALPLSAAEGTRAFPLWDGKETVESYAARVGMAATKSVDLGGGVKLDLVLIPAGEFVMGSAAPEKPRITLDSAVSLYSIGGIAAVVLLLLLIIQCIKKRKFSFSLRWLLLMTISIGLCAGGIARRALAIKEEARYEREMAEFNELPANEKPAHSVTLTQPFYMGKYTVTQEQYAAMIGKSPSDFKGAQLPVERVSLGDVREFCKKLHAQLKDKTLEARLPTEAQWEYACRAGTRTRFYSGDSDSDLDAAGWHDSNSGPTTHPVGQKKANAFGLYDMHGNVFQWCEDFYADEYKTAQTIDPVNKQGADRIVRGGAWLFNPSYCRSAYRGFNPSDYRSVISGFRVVLVLSSTP